MDRSSAWPGAGFWDLKFFCLAAAWLPLIFSFSCNPAQGAAQDTSSPAERLTQRPPATTTPFREMTPVAILESSHIPPSNTPTPIQINLPSEGISILEPGPNSHVTSPLVVAGRVHLPGIDRLRIRLYGEDGRLLSEGLSRTRYHRGEAGWFQDELDFEISLVAEAGRVEVAAFDPEIGELEHLSTVDLILLSIGQTSIHPVIEGAERLTILAPLPESEHKPGEILVRGATWTDSWLPLEVQVLDHSGDAVGWVEAPLEASALHQLGMFETKVHFDISTGQNGRIRVCEQSPTTDNPIHCASLSVILRP